MDSGLDASHRPGMTSAVGWAKEHLRRAHHLSSTLPLDGGHALLCRPYEATQRELICLACKRNLDARLRQTGTTGQIT